MEVLKNRQELSWDFRTADTKELTHCYHNYPARMIPQIARRLIKWYGVGTGKGILFDPFCGSGTVLVEGLLKEYNVIGTDINPLARLIAEAKCCPIEVSKLRSEMTTFYKYIYDIDLHKNQIAYPDFKNLYFWFTPVSIEQLSHIKHYINHISDEKIRLFFKVAFSETVRECSLTKSNEFKLVRRNGDSDWAINPNAYHIMIGKLNRNLKGLREFNKIYGQLSSQPVAQIYDFNTVNSLPPAIIGDGSVDIVITSPPYGDSATTVAYGQFSRLSNQWLDIKDSVAFSIDKQLMGGIKSSGIHPFGIPILDDIIGNIYARNPKRALIVHSFYDDLSRSCENVSRGVKIGGYVCYVISNRRVHGITLPTNQAVIEFYRRSGLVCLETFSRNIPNKRMPAKNSPSNIKGKVDSTMSTEHIIILRKVD